MNIIYKGQECLKKIGYDKIFVVILIGIMLVVMSMPAGKKTKLTEEKEYDSYETYLENKLEESLSKIEGVGSVNVVLKASKESKSTFQIKNEYPDIDGIIIIAEGGDDARVKSKIIEGIEALLNLPSHKICILKME